MSDHHTKMLALVNAAIARLQDDATELAAAGDDSLASIKRVKPINSTTSKEEIVAILAIVNAVEARIKARA